jgi:LPXTG-site transpeptidase (sortase) family protein
VSRGRAAVLALSIAVAVVAGAVALGGPSQGVAVLPSGSPVVGVSAPATATLPAVPTASATATSSPALTEIVADRIRIARLGIDLRIIEGDGIDAPLNKRVAHYPGTAWPDGGSNIYIYGHARAGLFLSLWEAKIGDEIELDLVDGTIRRYIVSEVKPRVPWNAREYLEPTPTEQLTLQTSTSYTPTAPRFIVIATPAP